MDVAVFELDLLYAVSLDRVKEVIALAPITPVPGMPLHLLGAMNVRGRVVPVLDLGLCLEGRPSSPRTGQESLLLQADENEVVACVGRIREVSRIRTPLVPAPAAEDPSPTRWIVPAVKEGKAEKLLLVEIERILQDTAQQIAERAALMQVSPFSLFSSSAPVRGDGGSSS